MRRALAHSKWFAVPDPRRHVIIAGTNGKGTTAAVLSALLTSAGARVGLYTSPHLVNVCERFRVNEADVPEPLFLRALEANLAVIEAERLTHFEALTLIAAWIFLSGEAIAPCDWCIWEVGLGGAWDATNAIPHHFCAITRLGLDHENLLGSTLREIAGQKFAVIPEGGIVVYSPMDETLAPLREKLRQEKKCKWIPASAAVLSKGILHTTWGSSPYSLEGPRAAENAATALSLAAEMGVKINLEALAQVRWPARFQRISWKGRDVYLSGDHNPQGMESLLVILKERRWNQLRIMLGICADKEVQQMTTMLATIPHHLYLTETPFRTLPLAGYPAEVRQRAAGMSSEPLLLLNKLTQEAAPDDLIVVTGSLYLAGLILSAVKNA